MVDASIDSLNVAVMAGFIATAMALFAGFVDETVGAVVSVASDVLVVFDFPLLPQAVSVIAVKQIRSTDRKKFFMATPPNNSFTTPSFLVARIMQETKIEGAEALLNLLES